MTDHTCPICGKHLLSKGLKLHIIQSAKREVYDHYLWGNNKLAPEPAMPHQYWIDDNTSVIVIRKIMGEVK